MPNVERPLEEYINRGIINLDKPPGPTSHEVVAWVKDILGVKRAGHTGTLDPNVSGVLPVLIGKSTKLAGAFLKSQKEYVCLMNLHADVADERLRNIIREFTGKIYQKPPVKAAVLRRIRVREIYYIEILDRDGRDVLMKVGCEAGTYVRKLVHDIGEALGCGANMLQLRRTYVGPFNEENSVTLHDLKDAFEVWREEKNDAPLRKIIRPLEDTLVHLPHIVVQDGAVDAVCHGADLAAPGVLGVGDRKIEKGDVVAMFTRKNEVIALGTAEMSSKEIEGAKSGIVAKTRSVMMETGTYPKGWKSGQ